jgi:hypothetical protein
MAEHNLIKVTVNFPLAGKPFENDFARTATVGDVRTACMEAFGVSEDPSTKYYLAHDRDKLGNDKTLESIAGHAEALKFTLVKEIIQGGC